MPFLTKSKIKQNRHSISVLKTEEAPSRSDVDTKSVDVKSDEDRKAKACLESLIETKKKLEKEVAEREETLRRLKLIHAYKSRKDIQNLDECIEKWKNVSKSVLNDLFDYFKSNSREDVDITMKEFLERMKVDPILVGFDCEKECFE